MNIKWSSGVAHACLVTIVITSTLLGVDVQAMDRCLTCDDFNRQRNGQGDGQCMDSYNDCGDCKHGFIKDEVDLRLCYQLELSRSPSDVVSGVGGSLELPCTFNGPVECEWRREGRVVVVGGRYKYVVKSGEGGRRDCSLSISSLSAEDVGRWSCGSPANSILSKPFRISIATTIKPTASSVSIGEDEGSEAENQPTTTITQRPAMETNSNVHTMSSVNNTTTLMTTLKSIIILLIVLLAMLMLCLIGFGFGKCLRRWRHEL